jgi:protein phosphatase
MKGVTIASATDVGRQKAENQDFHAFFPPEQGLQHPKGLLMALADGMGGHAAGATASRMAVETLMTSYYGDSGKDVRTSLRNAFEKANEAVHRKGREIDSLRGMGSTLTAAVLQKGRLYCAHVGDSRGYVVDGGRMRQFTRDHSYVAALVRAGIITEEAARSHPADHVVTRAIGIRREARFEVARKPLLLKSGQYVLLCCDGLWGPVPPDTIRSVVQQLRSPAAVCRRLVALANEKGGPDNITVVVARIDRIPPCAAFLSRCRSLGR